MSRPRPSPTQDFLSSVILPLLSIPLIPVSLAAVVVCVLHDRLAKAVGARKEPLRDGAGVERGVRRKCVMISGGRMAKGLHLARAFSRAGWDVIGVEEEGWGELCPLRFSSSLHSFHLLPPSSPSASYQAYSARLSSIAKSHAVDLFIPVSGAGSSVEDARAAESLYTATNGRCQTIIQDPETMMDLHDKDRFSSLVRRLGMRAPRGGMVVSVRGAMEFLEGERECRRGEQGVFILKCMRLDENRGDMTLYPLVGDDDEMSATRRRLEGLRMGISEDCPYVFQEFIPGQEWCTHASVLSGVLTSFVACPSNDMLMTYENATLSRTGQLAEQWTLDLLSALSRDPTSTGGKRNLTGHFSFDFISSSRDGEMYPIECNARVHTAVVMLQLDEIAACYDLDGVDGGDGYQRGGMGTSENGRDTNVKTGETNLSKRTRTVLRPKPNTLPRSWTYNNLVMRGIPALLPCTLLGIIHPSLPACAPSSATNNEANNAPTRPIENIFAWAIEPTLVADDWVPFLALWHVWWPYLLVMRWWAGKRWTRLNVSTGRIFEA